jgi:2-methylcitrate dehydratase
MPVLSKLVARSIQPFAGRFFSTSNYVALKRDTNQAIGIGQYAVDLLSGKYGDNIDESVYEHVKVFHTDSVMCGVSSLALKTNAPTLLRKEALSYADPKSARVFGSPQTCAPEKVGYWAFRWCCTCYFRPL